jgi:alpha-glucoside transport system permease protein
MEQKPFWQDTFSKLGSMGLSVLIFFAVLLVVFYLAGRAKGKFQKPITLVVFLFPAILLVSIGLVIPLIQTIFFSFKDPNSVKFVGWDNYKWIFTNTDMHKVLLNTVLWLLVTPFLTTFLGLVLAIFLDRMKRESIPKSLIFMPMAVSFVGASIIWQFVYNYNPPGQPQIGLLSALWDVMGIKPPNWLLTPNLNTFLLMVIFVWVQTGFAMIILSAAVKAVPMDIVEASALDGASGRKLFRFITFPMVRSTVIVVFVTELVTTLKLFDIVRTVTGGNFGTSVLSNEMFSEIFVRFDTGRGSAMAVVLFVFILPIMAYNIYNLRRERSNA